MKPTPHSARIYIFLAALFLALPAINKTIYPSKSGQLLVSPVGSAAPFDDAVIYIMHHDLFSAHGVIINKPQKDAALIGGKIPFYGGPVSTGTHLDHYDMTGEKKPYLGYAGWAPLQLDYELFRGFWHIIDADADILGAEPETMWQKAMEKVPKDKSEIVL